MSKLKLYHFYNGNGGGVHSVIKNLLRFSQNPAIENHVIHAINQQIHPSYTIEPMEGAASEQLCLYSPKDNFYHTCKKLAACLPDEKAVVIAHDWIELGMMSNLGLQNKVVYFLHGDYDYYYELAQKHHAAIDGYICIAENISIKLKGILKNGESVYYHRIPVPEAKEGLPKIENSITFIGRLEQQKGYDVLPKIASLLAISNFNIQWFIFGEGNLNVQWPKGAQVELLGKLSNKKVLEHLCKMEIILLPSLAEGMPVSILEAMKSEVVPIVNDIDGGLRELVDEHQNRGFRIKDNSADEYARKIHLLLSDHNLRRTMQKECKAYADRYFNPHHTTGIIEDTILNISSATVKKKTIEKVYGSRLDQLWLPNVITRFIRNNT